MRGGDSLGYPLDALQHRLAPLRGQRADRPLQLGRFGDDVVGGAALNAGDGHHGRIEHVHRPGHHALQGLDDLACDRDGVLGTVRRRRVAALAVNGDDDAVGGGTERAPLPLDDARGLVRDDVDSEGGLRGLRAFQ
jgi:hypothetical protein